MRIESAHTPAHLLAGDVGGTKTLLGLFEHGEGRPRPTIVRSYPTADFQSFIDILDAFARDVAHPFTVGAAAMGVAGPVVDGHARLTNVGWEVSAAEIAQRFAAPHVRLLNDLEAMAISVEWLSGAELDVLQAGTPGRPGNAVVIAAGTGLGEAYLHRIAAAADAAAGAAASEAARRRPTFHAAASEAGHADFAARTDREMDMVRMLRDLYGRAEIEQVLSGPGLLNLHRFSHRDAGCLAVPDLGAHEAPAQVSQAAIDGACAGCVEALALFVEAYGAEAGNLALRGMAVAGVYIGGGIAPKILSSLRDGRFMQAFLAKPPMADLLTTMPVQVILNAEAGLLGAAVAAQELFFS